jgi:ATP-binding cassette subfamily B protein
VSSSRSAALRLLWTESGPVRLTAASALAVLTVSVVATLGGPLLVQHFVDLATAGAAEPALITVALWYLALALVAGATRILASYLSVHCGWRVADSLRVRLLRHAAVDRPVLEVESRPVGEVLEQVEGNADVVGKAIAESGFRMISNIAVGLGTVAVIFVELPAAGIGILVLLLAVYLVLSRLARRAVQRWAMARQQQARLFGFLGDTLAARQDLYQLRETGWATERTRTGLDSLLRTEGRAYIAGRIFWPVTQLCFALAFGLGFGFGLHALAAGTLTVGSLTMIYLYVNLLQQPLEEMSSQTGQLQQMMAVLTLASEWLGARREPPPAEGLVLPDGPLEVTFDHVTFGYGDRPVLRDVSFTVAPGASLGIVGPTGAGKSTVVNLLCGLAAPDQGRVLLGGVELSRISPAEFADRVTVLSQRAHVFSASVHDNVTLFDGSIPRAQVLAVLTRLGAVEWVSALADGLDTRIGTGARQLSAGEMQVLAGARALIRPYSLLVVDEGASRLDAVAERSWSRLVDSVMEDRTVVMVEHRLTALGGVDEVMTLREGVVVDRAAVQDGAVR